jgi:hypothetical protein
MMRASRQPEEITMSTPARPAPESDVDHWGAVGRRRNLADLGDQVDEALVEQYVRDGYVVLPEVLTREEVAAVNAEAVALCRGELGEIRPG